MAKILKVTTIDFYEIEKVMQSNGWTEEQVIRDWFESGRMSVSHASRDANRISGARVFVDAQEIDLYEFAAYFEEDRRAHGK